MATKKAESAPDPLPVTNAELLKRLVALEDRLDESASKEERADIRREIVEVKESLKSRRAGADDGDRDGFPELF